MNWPAFLVFAVVTTITPGPNTILSMRNAARFGFKKSYVFNLGLLAGCACVMALCTVFSTVFYAVLPKVRPVMQVLGAAYILYLAFRTLFPKKAAKQQKEHGSLFAQGLLLPFVNPKYYLYCLTAMSTYVLAFTTKPLQVAGFAALLLFIGFEAAICWALCGSALQSVMQKHEKAINIVMALLLVYCAMALFF